MGKLRQFRVEKATTKIASSSKVKRLKPRINKQRFVVSEIDCSEDSTLEEPNIQDRALNVAVTEVPNFRDDVSHYIFNEDTGVLLLLQNTACAQICGPANMTVLQGSVYAYGTLWDNKTTDLLISGIGVTEHVAISAKYTGGNIPIRRRLAQYDFANSKRIAELASKGPWCVIFFTTSSFATSKVLKARNEVPEFMSGMYAKFGFYIQFLSESSDDNPMITDWNTLCAEVREGDQSTVSSCPPRVIITGSRNAGKSTFLRCLTNNLLSTYREIIWLDCDPGQSEFTPCGCVSLVRVTNPLTGPAYTHLIAPEKAFFLGVVTPYLCGDYYTNCINELVLHYETNFTHLPLIVNTMGWIESFGAAFLIDTARYVLPTHVIYIKAERREYFDPLCFKEADGWQTTRDHEGAVKLRESGYDVLEVTKPPNWIVPACKRAASAALREYTLYAFLDRLTGDHASLWNVVPHCISWSSVAVHETTAIVPKNHILYALNGSLIALCRVPVSQMLTSSDKTLPKFVKRDSLLEFIGYGVLRCIDVNQKMFFVITDEPLHRLKEVNCLVKGSIDLPDDIVLEQRSTVGVHVPYVSLKRRDLQSQILADLNGESDIKTEDV